jgi:DNA gyrase subunit A
VGALLGQSGAVLIGVLTPGALAVLGTRGGVVKRTIVDVPKVPVPIITLAPGDALVAALPCPETVADLVFVTANGQVLRFPTSSVRPQQRAASGMAAIALADGDAVVAVGAPAEPGSHLAVATDTGAVKYTTLDDIPVKGRATAGVRALRFLAGQSRVAAAAVGTGLQPRTKTGKVLPAPAPARRDASAQVLTAPVAGFVTPVA